MMWQVIAELSPLSADGRDYRVVVEGQARQDGTWAGRIAFTDGATRRLTEQETSQPTRAALEYWATGLEKIYIEGAFIRSH